MTTKQAWYNIAEMWDGKETPATNRGLCKSIQQLHLVNLITEEQRQSMDTQIIKYKRSIDCYSAYIWPMGECYRKHRAELARKLGDEAI